MGVLSDITGAMGRMARNCTLSVLNAMERRQSLRETEARFDARPRPVRVATIAAVVLGLLLLSLLFAQAGLIGVGAYLALVFLIIR